MPEYPRYCHCRFGDTVLVGNALEDGVKFGKARVIQEHAFEKPKLQRRPSLDGDFFQPVAYRYSPSRTMAPSVSMFVNSCVDHPSMSWPKLQLIEHYLLRKRLQQLDPHGIMVADAKEPHLSSFSSAAKPQRLLLVPSVYQADVEEVRRHNLSSPL